MSSRSDRRRELGGRAASVVAAAAAVVVIACGGAAPDDGAGREEGPAGSRAQPADTTAAPGGAAAGETAAGVGGGVDAGEAPPVAGPGPDTPGEAAGGADSAWIRMAAAQPDTAWAGHFFVRLASGADPGTVAERHGVEELEVVPEEDVTAFYARLTWGEVGSLAADRQVRSLSQAIEAGDTLRPPIRTVPTTDTGGR